MWEGVSQLKGAFIAPCIRSQVGKPTHISVVVAFILRMPQNTLDSTSYDIAEILGMIRYELAKLNIRQAELIEVLEQAYNGGWG